jgi:hypothetical protein
MEKFLTIGYWLHQPTLLQDGLYAYGAVVALFWMLAVVVYVIRKQKKENKALYTVLRGLSSSMFWFGFTALLFTFLRYEGVYIFSSRIWMVLIAVVFLIWAIPSSISLRREYKRLSQRAEKKEDTKKYHPKQKKKAKKKR